jgi:hypothetical protein
MTDFDVGALENGLGAVGLQALKDRYTRPGSLTSVPAIVASDGSVHPGDQVPNVTTNNPAANALPPPGGGLLGGLGGVAGGSALTVFLIFAVVAGAAYFLARR